VVKESPSKLRHLVGRRISEVRRSCEITQEALAEKLDVSTQWLSRVENGRENLTLDTIVRFANILGVGVIELITIPSVEVDLPKRVRPRPRRSRL
jgi:transcriptional regulator with XRE-family HTH domain